MGVRGLMPLLKRYAAPTLGSLHLETLRGYTLYFDASLYIMKFAAIYTTTWTPALATFALNLQTRFGVRPVFVFDGPRDPNKDVVGRIQAGQKRRERLRLIKRKIVRLSPLDKAEKNLLKSVVKENRDTLSALDSAIHFTMGVQANDKDALQNNLHFHGIHYVTAANDAEKYAAKLHRENEKSAIVTADTDVIAMDTQLVIREINGSIATYVRPQGIPDSLGITRAQFVDLCVLMGTDYSARIHGIGPERAYSAIKEHGTIEAIPDKRVIENEKQLQLSLKWYINLFILIKTYIRASQISVGPNSEC